MQALLTAVMLLLSQAAPPISRGQTVLWSLLSAGADASPGAGAAPCRRSAVSHQACMAPAQAVSRDVHSPIDRAPSVSTNSALQLGMVNQPLMQLRYVSCAKSSAVRETLLLSSQQPCPTTTFPETGLQRKGKGSLIALLVRLVCVGRSQTWEQVSAELQVKHRYLPLVQITALLTDPCAGALWAMLLPGQPLEVSSTAGLNTEIHTAPI